jgi:hypothetical protein
MNLMKRILVIVAGAAMSIGLVAGPASAQPRQEGLINVNLSDNTVQVPIAAAVNICDLNVAALAEIIDAGGDSCDAVAKSDAKDRRRGPSHVSQEGLVNVNVSGNTIQVPVAVAANICDVNVAVLATLIDVPGASCDARAGSNANA